MRPGGKYCVLPAQHPVEQIHIPLCRHIPAEVGAHAPLLQPPEGVPVAVVQVQAALDRPLEIVAVVALEGEAQTLVAVFVGRGHGVPA